VATLAFDLAASECSPAVLPGRHYSELIRCCFWHSQ
jgi:hypothetical protein